MQVDPLQGEGQIPRFINSSEPSLFGDSTRWRQRNAACLSSSRATRARLRNKPEQTPVEILEGTDQDKYFGSVKWRSSWRTPASRVAGDDLADRVVGEDTPSLSTSSSRNIGFLLPACFMPWMIRPGRAHDVRAAVAADVGLVTRAAEREADVLAAHRAGDRLGDRGLADAGGTGGRVRSSASTSSVILRAPGAWSMRHLFLAGRWGQRIIWNHRADGGWP